MVKVSMPVAAPAVVVRGESQISVRPGQMLLYDLGPAYDTVHEQAFSSLALTFHRDALPLPYPILRQSLGRPFPIDSGAGAVLADFTRAAIREGASLTGAAGHMSDAAGRLGNAGLHLIAGALGARLPDEETAADAQRIKVLHYVRAHLADPDLTHRRVAAAHYIAPRTLDRLFEHESYTVTEYIRLQRLEAAKSELTNPLFRHRTIAVIAARWGFLSQAHFTRTFQARYGFTPSTARRNA